MINDQKDVNIFNLFLMDSSFHARKVTGNDLSRKPCAGDELILNISAGFYLKEKVRAQGNFGLWPMY